MPPTFEPLVVPLTTHPGGSVRIEGTRITLEEVIGEFDGGASPEEIVLRYPTLTLEKVYGAIAYYLAHPDAIQDYLRERGSLEAEVRSRIAARSDQRGLRERLLARRAVAEPQR